MKYLDEILKGIDYIKVTGNRKIKVSDIAFDSRKVNEKSIFFAIKGTSADGHKYIADAIGSGAKCIVYDREKVNTREDVVFIKVDDSAIALAKAACNFYDNPSKKLKLVGVTGTNGKTTIATLLYEVFEKLGHKTGLISTITNKVHKKNITATHTTPDPLKINLLLSEMVKGGCTYCFMEVSSHSVDQSRIEGLQFDGGIFTNITHDHLDYHETFENYLNAKKSFFDKLNNGAFAVVNGDSKHSEYMLQNTKAIKKTFSLKKPGDFKGRVLESDFSGMHMSINNKELYTEKIADFNASNLLAVYATSVMLGADDDKVLEILSSPISVSGRFEILPNDKKVLCIVDYAHTPDALKNLLLSIKRINMKTEKVICVMGCGGDRDKAKRPEMGQIVVSKSDIVIITNDNPRFEDPEVIISEILGGIDEEYMDKVIVIPDREEAIKKACDIVVENNILIVAGKGHETYQDINGVKSDFDDKVILRKYLNR